MIPSKGLRSSSNLKVVRDEKSLQFLKKIKGCSKDAALRTNESLRFSSNTGERI